MQSEWNAAVLKTESFAKDLGLAVFCSVGGGVCSKFKVTPVDWPNERNDECDCRLMIKRKLSLNLQNNDLHIPLASPNVMRAQHIQSHNCKLQSKINLVL